MPRHVDHDGRRREIADAVCALISWRGLEGVTLREVAGHAGVSMGAVQRCFRTKAEMLLFAQEHVNRTATERARARIEAAAEPGSVATMLAETLAALVAVDDPDLTGARVWIAFTAQAVVEPALAAAQQWHHAGLVDLLTVLLRTGQDRGEIRPDIEVDREVDTMITLADGLTVQVLLGRHTRESAIAAIRAHAGHLRLGRP
ncbi:TetR/AcrR family transcriptional regulator [Kutzneria sp. NPDC052558]|uniref:TetR/AcrR family transcriptional regulator n=1 Tax=Kutzneria sp. NPDC052558 TaxID=3364121 RepID=UPI0037C5B45B